jgi:predicted nucleotidyltransferase
MSLSTVQLGKVPTIDVVKVIQMSELPDWKIKNIYLYGSRVYGTNKEDSDYDILMLASTMNQKEIKDFTYNIHIKTPDVFYDMLLQYKMVALECLFAPSFAKIKESNDYLAKFNLNKINMKKSVLSQSHDSWMKAKFKINEEDILRGAKSLFHSLRMLLFGIQIAEYGSIVDFSEANKYFEDVENYQSLEWDKYKKQFLPLKCELEQMLKKAE